MRLILLHILFLIMTISAVTGQGITAGVPAEVDIQAKYLFYLHGGVVQQQGENAVSRYYGAYKYRDILDTLSSYGYRVISEVRPKDTGEAEYAEKVSKQVEKLLDGGASPENITIIGASLGAYIALEAAARIQESRINYAVLGLCSKYAVDYFSRYKKVLKGNFLSIYKSTDEKRSCDPLFLDQSDKAVYREIKIEMGIGHGFLYKPYPEWVRPLVRWIEESGRD